MKRPCHEHHEQCTRMLDSQRPGSVDERLTQFLDPSSPLLPSKGKGGLRLLSARTMRTSTPPAGRLGVARCLSGSTLPARTIHAEFPKIRPNLPFPPKPHAVTLLTLSLALTESS